MLQNQINEFFDTLNAVDGIVQFINMSRKPSYKTLEVLISSLEYLDMQWQSMQRSMCQLQNKPAQIPASVAPRFTDNCFSWTQFLEQNRHQHPDLQRSYDKKFGLSLHVNK